MSRKLTAFSLGTNLHTEKVIPHVNRAETDELQQDAVAVGSPPPAAHKIPRERLNVNVPAFVFEWFRNTAHENRVNITDFVTHLMLDYMEQSGTDKALTDPLRPKNLIPRPEKEI